MPADLPPDAPALSPVERWRQAALAWAVPEALGAAAPEPPAVLEPEMFRWRPEDDAKQPVRPSRRRALEALPERGSVLDVGVGGGASSLGLLPRAALITGVDHNEGMLESFLASAEAVGVEARAIHGAWPDVAPEVGVADIAVCHHAIYGIADIEDFIAALTDRARHRVVVEVSASAPLASLNPLWKAFHGIERPDRRVADEAETVLSSLGLAVEREDMVLEARAHEVTARMVAFARRRLCVGADRDPEIAEFLQARPPQEQRVVALWWPGGGQE